MRRSYDKNQLDALISQIYFWSKTLHVWDSFLCPSSGFFDCTHSNSICQTASELSAQLYDIPLLCVR